MSHHNGRIDPEMTVLDVVSLWRETESVFKRYDARAGECICCRSLFESVRNVSDKYQLDLEMLLADLEAARE
ncbi:MAG: hypothetical protein J7M32_00390 [Deltaproteobacteria bacterium]|nr:hypothetical protein [Deltaproteobacteria bacterium]